MDQAKNNETGIFKQAFKILNIYTSIIFLLKSHL